LFQTHLQLFLGGRKHVKKPIGASEKKVTAKFGGK